MQRFAVTLRLK